jgi:hypothetical protein
MQCLDLQILRPLPPVAVVVLDARIWELHVSIVLRKAVLNGPTMNLFRRSIGSAVAVGSTAVALLKELLVLALKLVVEDDAADATALTAQALGGLQICAINLRVVGQLARLLETRVEPLVSRAGIRLLAVTPRAALVEFGSPRSQVSFLPRTDRRSVVTFENVSTLLRQDHQRTVVAGGRRDLHKPRFLEMPEVTRAWVQGTLLSVAQVTGRDHAKGSNDGQRSRLGAA